MGTVSFPGVKRLEHGDDHPPPYGAEVKERVKLFLYSPFTYLHIAPRLRKE
jgi:hypothetical protein